MLHFIIKSSAHTAHVTNPNNTPASLWTQIVLSDCKKKHQFTTCFCSSHRCQVWRVRSRLFREPSGAWWPLLALPVQQQHRHARPGVLWRSNRRLPQVPVPHRGLQVSALQAGLLRQCCHSELQEWVYVNVVTFFMYVCVHILYMYVAQHGWLPEDEPRGTFKVPSRNF